MSAEITNLENLIKKKEADLSRAEGESQSLSFGKYKSSSNSAISKILVNSLRREINDLYKQLEELRV
ncbi:MULTISPECIES: hypothetical protein [Halomonadaceae]|uniref:hypothetical protein n=1 Tax=Halomonadaceae TaxID=28256 RepID=UPI0012FEB6A9|nr:hypothetical protein [Halomonas sp. MES3-P3E]|tara:strand:+ start:290 stop:490 length:201 start_codon:yes stop_codon:yes gene_type:complete